MPTIPEIDYKSECGRLRGELGQLHDECMADLKASIHIGLELKAAEQALADMQRRLDCAALVPPGDSSQPGRVGGWVSVPREETGWVIVRDLPGTLGYFDGVHFDTDNLEAIRFSRQLDAERYLNLLHGDKVPQGDRVEEHMWVDSPLPAMPRRPRPNSNLQESPMNTAVAAKELTVLPIIPGHRFDDGRFAGIARNYADDGVLGYDVTLLNAKPPKERMTWQEAMDWAKSIGADLPTRKEQALLFANLADEFQRDAYWSNKPNAGTASYAWCQHFGNGRQWLSNKVNELLAVAVRRSPIQ
jgi:hypothetical protein